MSPSRPSHDDPVVSAEWTHPSCRAPVLDGSRLHPRNADPEPAIGGGGELEHRLERVQLVALLEKREQFASAAGAVQEKASRRRWKVSVQHPLLEAQQPRSLVLRISVLPLGAVIAVQREALQGWAVQRGRKLRADFQQMAEGAVPGQVPGKQRPLERTRDSQR